MDFLSEDKKVCFEENLFGNSGKLPKVLEPTNKITWL